LKTIFCLSVVSPALWASRTAAPFRFGSRDLGTGIWIPCHVRLQMSSVIFDMTTCRINHSRVSRPFSRRIAGISQPGGCTATGLQRDLAREFHLQSVTSSALAVNWVVKTGTHAEKSSCFGPVRDASGWFLESCEWTAQYYPTIFDHTNLHTNWSGIKLIWWVLGFYEVELVFLGT